LMADLIAIGDPEEARACHARDEVNQLITPPDAARAIIRNSEGSIWVATNPLCAGRGDHLGNVVGVAGRADLRHGLGGWPSV
jgi:hypothetical protein